jgi:hypothetical protein
MDRPVPTTRIGPTHGGTDQPVTGVTPTIWGGGYTRTHGNEALPFPGKDRAVTFKPNFTIGLVATALMITAGQAIADTGVLEAPKGAKSEQITAADGGKSTYRAGLSMTCEGTFCLFDFGKKKGKVRTIEWVNCAIATASDEFVYMAVSVSGNVVPIAFAEIVGQTTAADTSITIAQVDYPFEVGAGETLTIAAFATTTAYSGICNVAGTIK